MSWSQQPWGHEVASQTQFPPLQRCPGPQAARVPHWQAPAALQVSAVLESQAEQAAPGAPQAASDRVVQLVPLQQPLGHEVALQTHWPCTQRCPPPQGALAPHRQVPPSPQVSAVLLSHETQLAPAVPQALSLGEVQVLPLQQPPGHELALHVQCPPTHACPAEHGPWGPQRHCPDDEQLSERRSQAVQTPPDGPQVASDRRLHTFPAQHPFEQVVLSQTQLPARQRCPVVQAPFGPHRHVPEGPQLSATLVGQATQVDPWLPHEVIDRIWQVEPWQQPLGHEVASQTHKPFAHRWPSAQGAVLPQRQAPPAEQESARRGLQAVQAAPPTPHAETVGVTHVEPEQQPAVQVTMQPLQTPLRQVSAAGHARHSWPALPHALSMVPPTQVPFWQQPSGQEVPSHTHWPREQCSPAAQGAVAPHRQVPCAHWSD